MDSHPASLGRVSGVHVDGRDLPAPRALPSAIAADGGTTAPIFKKPSWIRDVTPRV